MTTNGGAYSSRVGSLKSRCGQGCAPSEGSRGGRFLPLPVSNVVGSLWDYLAPRCITVASVVFIVCVSMSKFPSSCEGTSPVGLGSTLTPFERILTQLYLQRHYFQIRSHTCPRRGLEPNYFGDTIQPCTELFTARALFTLMSQFFHLQTGDNSHTFLIGRMWGLNWLRDIACLELCWTCSKQAVRGLCS